MLKNKLNAEKLASISSHYKDTQRILEKTVKARDIYFFSIIGVIIIFTFQIFSPTESGGLFNEIIKSQLNSETVIRPVYITSVLWFTLLALSVRYFQSVIYLEKQYVYIHSLESILSKEFNGIAFTREGKNYLNEYAIFSNWMHIIYMYIFPLVLIAFVVIKLWNEIHLPDVSSTALLLNLFMGITLIISTLLFIYSIKKAK